MTFHLTAEATAKAARKALDTKRLTAFSNPPVCVYRNRDGRKCAVGVALPAAILRKITRDDLQSVCVEALPPDVFTFDRGVIELQSAHDEWVNSMSGYYSPPHQAAAEAKFRAVLDEYDPQPEA